VRGTPFVPSIATQTQGHNTRDTPSEGYSCHMFIHPATMLQKNLRTLRHNNETWYRSATEI